MKRKAVPAEKEINATGGMEQLRIVLLKIKNIYLINLKSTKMKKTVFLAAIISVFSITATYAQDTPPPSKDKKEARSGERRGPGGMGMMDMYKDLNLTKEQEAKIKTINEEQRTKFEALRNDNSLSDEARKEKRMEMMKERKEKVDAVLTKEQKEKLEAKMKERGNRGPGEKGGDKK